MKAHPATGEGSHRLSPSQPLALHTASVTDFCDIKSSHPLVPQGSKMLYEPLMERIGCYRRSVVASLTEAPREPAKRPDWPYVETSRWDADARLRRTG